MSRRAPTRLPSCAAASSGPGERPRGRDGSPGARRRGSPGRLDHLVAEAVIRNRPNDPVDRPVFLPIVPPPSLSTPIDPEAIVPVSNPAPAPVATAAVEIVLCNGRSLCVSGDIDNATLARLICVVEVA